MNKRRHWETLYKAVLLVMVFLLASEPMLVAAQPSHVDPRQEAIDTLTASGDVYLTNVVETLSLSAGLVSSVSAIQSTPLTQLSENIPPSAVMFSLSGIQHPPFPGSSIP